MKDKFPKKDVRKMQITEQTRRTSPLPRELTAVLPSALSDEIIHRGISYAEEIRLHEDRICTVSVGDRNLPLGFIPNAAQMCETLQRMCGGSLYAYSQTICQGYLTMAGGIRVGVCGSAAIEGGRVICVSAVTGLIIRIPHRVRVSVTPLTEALFRHRSARGMLIYGRPASGKTTVLRALAEAAASSPYSLRTVAVDTREELCYGLGGSDLLLDILIGYPRDLGIEIAVRSLGAQLVILDEIGSPADAEAILNAANCGVPIVASAHADSLSEVLLRPAIRRLHEARVFSRYAGLTRDTDGISFRISEASDKIE